MCIARNGRNGISTTMQPPDMMAWALIAFVPVLNVVMFLVFAFSDWPVLRQRAAGLDPPISAPGLKRAVEGAWSRCV